VGWKLTAPKDFKPSESQIELAILNHLTYVRKHFAYKVHCSGYFDSRLKRFRKQSNPFAISGLADIYCHLKNVPHLKGVTVHFEIKSEKGRQTLNQKKFEMRVKECGGYYFEVRSIAEVDEALKTLGAV
jgi:hypothetical protein